MLVAPFRAGLPVERRTTPLRGTQVTYQREMEPNVPGVDENQVRVGASAPTRAGDDLSSAVVSYVT